MPTKTHPLVLASLLALAAMTQASDARAQAAPRAPSAQTPPGAVRRTFAVGARVEVLWNGTWFASTILAANPDGTYRVHYEGWSGAWDEDVGADRIR